MIYICFIKDPESSSGWHKKYTGLLRTLQWQYSKNIMKIPAFAGMTKSFMNEEGMTKYFMNDNYKQKTKITQKKKLSIESFFFKILIYQVIIYKEVHYHHQQHYQ